MKVSPVTLLESGSPNLQCLQDCAPHEGSREDDSSPLPAPHCCWGPWLTGLSLRFLPLLSHGVFPVSSSRLLMNTHIIGLTASSSSV